MLTELDGSGRLPNAILCGAPRSGTTTLFRALADHPSVFAAPGKELHFFDERWGEGLEWYAAKFAGAVDESVVLEATPRYLANGEAMARIASTLPGVQLMAILRDPAERAHSHFHYRVARGLDKGTLEEAVERELRGDPAAFPYVAIGRYYEQLSHVGDLGLEHPVVLLWYDDLNGAPGLVADELASSLGIDAGSLDLAQRVNSADRFRSVKLRRLSRRLPPTAKSAVGRLNRRQVSYPPLASSTRARIIETLERDILALSRMTNRPLTAWIEP